MPLVDHLVEVLTKETYTETELAEFLDKPKEVLAYWRVTSGDVPVYDMVHGVPVYWRHEILRWVETQTNKDEEKKLDLFEEKPKRKMNNREVLFKLLDDHPRTTLKVLCERHGINQKTGYNIYRKWLVARRLTESPHVKAKSKRDNDTWWYNNYKEPEMKEENPMRAERPQYPEKETTKRKVTEGDVRLAVISGFTLGIVFTIIAASIGGFI
jgi:hypothetical protein